MDSIDTLIQPHIDNQAALGAAIAVLKGGEVIYLGGFGTTSVEDHGAPVTPQTLFAYGSICKNICATLIMRLVEQNLLNLDKPVVDYLPDLLFSDADYGKKITLRHLLSHTSGLPMGGKYWGPRDPDSLRRFVYEQIPYYTFLSEPGAVHLYSNTVFCIAGHIAEVVTGKFYDDLIQEQVFDPLQMDRVTFDPVVAMTYSVALPHETDSDGDLRVKHRMTYNVSGNPSSFALGSVADLAKLARMYLNRGQVGDQQFLSAASVGEMQRLHSRRTMIGAAHTLAQVNQGYGLGFEIGEYKSRRMARHGGMNLSNNCYFDLFPDNQTGVILLTNYYNEGPLMELVAELYDYALGIPHQGIVFLKKPPPLDVPPDHSQLQCYAGTFLRVETAELATFTVVDDVLVLERGAESTPLVPLGNDQFYAEFSERYRMPVAFSLDSNGMVRHATIWRDPYHPVVLDPKLQPDLQLWKSFEGIYKDPSNSNPEDIFSVRLQDEMLFIAEGEREVPCTTINRRCFLSKLGLFEFEDTGSATPPVLVWGKATRYYPLDIDEYKTKGVIRYLVDFPAIPPRLTVTQPLHFKSSER